MRGVRGVAARRSEVARMTGVGAVILHTLYMGQEEKSDMEGSELGFEIDEVVQDRAG